MTCCFLCCCKQKVARVCLHMWSFLLFLSGIFTIYISICLFLKIDILGGIASTKGDGTGLENDGPKMKVRNINYFDSYVHTGTLICGVLAIMLSILGCCTSISRDRCFVGILSLFSFLLLVVFGFFGGVMTTLHWHSDNFIDYYCSENQLI